MVENTNRHQLPYIMAAQAQKHVTHNEALRKLDSLVNISFAEVGLDQPPANAVEGSIYLIGQSPLQEWQNHAGEIACFCDGAWEFHSPFDGLQGFDLGTDQFIIYKAGQWQEIGGGSGEFDQVSINTQADPNNKLSVKADSVLLSHDDVTPGSGNSLITVNRATDQDLAHVQYSTDHTVNAETGVAGDKSYRIKLSDDGTNFTTALAIEPVDGKIGIGTEPGGSQQVHVRKDQGQSTRLSISNYSLDAGAASSIRLHTANGHYLSTLLYATGTAFYYSNTTMIFGTFADKSLILRTNTTNRVTIHGDGRVSIGTATPSAQLAVEGAVRAGQFTKANLPDAAINGTGSMIYVSDATGGAEMAFSDGSVWRRNSDRTQID